MTEQPPEYTGKTVRLPELVNYQVRPASKELKPRYIAKENGDNWLVIDTTRMPLETSESHADERDTQTGIPILQNQQNGAQNVTAKTVHVKLHKQPYTAHNPITDSLLPIIACLVLTLAIVVIGDYRTLDSIPLELIIPTLAIGLIGYLSYRYSVWYERGGKALERFMRATHDEHGKLNRENAKLLLQGKLHVIEEEDEKD